MVGETSEEGFALLASLVRAFKPCIERDENTGKNICRCIATCDAAQLVVPLYDKLFGEGIISNILKKDLGGSAAGWKNAVLTNEEEWNTVEGLCKGETTLRGLETVRKDKSSGVVKMLWARRALQFIASFLDHAFLIMPDAPIKDAASAAYVCVLQRYHGYVTSKVVAAAFRIAPDRMQLLKALGFSGLRDATVAVKDFLSTLHPVLCTIERAMEDCGCNFQDKA